jgi:hypothetical protein
MAVIPDAAKVAALVAWYRRQASESPVVDAALYAVAVLNAAHAVLQAAAFWYWGVIPVTGASNEPQVLICRVQKLVHASPHCPLVATVTRSPAGPACGQCVAGVVIEGAPAW